MEPCLLVTKSSPPSGGAQKKRVVRSGDTIYPVVRYYRNLDHTTHITYHTRGHKLSLVPTYLRTYLLLTMLGYLEGYCASWTERAPGGRVLSVLDRESTSGQQIKPFFFFEEEGSWTSWTERAPGGRVLSVLDRESTSGQQICCCANEDRC